MENYMTYSDCKVLSVLQHKEEPLISKIPCDEYTQLAQSYFDYEFLGESKFYPYKLPKVLNEIDYKICVITGSSGKGKAQPIDVIIPTPNGFKKLGDVKIGDYVFDRYGKPTKVVGVFPQGKLDVYTVTLKDGRSTQCNDEHLWSYYSHGKLTTKSLKDISSLSKIVDIPLNKPIEYPKKEYDVDPYVIGSFIGNGYCKSKTNGISLSSDDEEQVKLVADLLNAKYVRISNKNYSWYFENKKICEENNARKDCKFIRAEHIFKKYKSEICVYSYEKSIPNEYKYGSIEQRFSLLQGLFDTDGYITEYYPKPRFNVGYTTTSKKLCDDICEILYSLGYACSVKLHDRRNKKNNDNIKHPHVEYNIYVMIDNNEKYKLFRCSKKRNVALKAMKYKKYHRLYDRIPIKSIKKENYQKEMVCIYVDNEEHLYLTNDYIVTHNTQLLKEFPFYSKEPKVFDNSKSVISNFDFTDKEDCMDRLASVGLSTVPTWCRPRNVLSVGEGFRADLALNIQSEMCFDEFTSTVDRNVAISTVLGIKKYIVKHNLKKVVFCSCHKDYIDYLEPDIVIDLDDEKVYDCRGVDLKKALSCQSTRSLTTQRKKTFGKYLGSIII